VFVTKSAVATIEIIEVFSIAELLIEESCVVDDDALELSIELLIVDAVTSFDFPIQSRSSRFDVDVADTLVEQVVVK
jgi:hypothetical protein